MHSHSHTARSHTSKTCTASRGRPQGFTLLEVLVVITIMGLLVGLAVTIVRPDDRAVLRVEAQRMAQLFELAAIEARFTGRTIAWTSTADTYQFWQRDGLSPWTEIRDNDSLRQRSLAEGATLSGLLINNSPVSRGMRLEFAPNSAAPVFVLTLTLGDAQLRVTGSPIGEISVATVAGAATGEEGATNARAQY